MSDKIWSRERPTVTGHYWYADDHYPAPIMVFVTCYGCFEDSVYYFSGVKVALSAHRGYWYFVPEPAMICKRDKMVNHLKMVTV